MNQDAQPWWRSFYDDHLADILLENTSQEEIANTICYLQKVLHLPAEGGLVFDQCCGSGRLSWAMSVVGHRVLGVDLIPSYIQRAEAKADHYPHVTRVPRFEADDALTYVAAEPCDAAFNWWTSFGYAADDATNLLMLRRARESLKPGGRFALDFMNVPGLLHGFLPQVVTRLQRDEGELVLVRESRLDLAAGVLEKDWEYFLPDGKRVKHRTRVRLYDPATLLRLFTEAGFEDIQIHGDTDGSAITLKSPRCLVVGRRAL
jgi:SAM-dependent methyltransferase